MSPIQPAVVVAMPTYNHAAFIGCAIESVLAQTLTAWELVIVDDGSTDGTLDVAKRYADPRISVVALDHHGLSGLGATYRTVLERSTAPLVAILEGDDRWPPGKLAHQVPDFDDPSVVLSYGAGELIDDFGCVYGRVQPSFAPSLRTNRPTGVIVAELLAVNPILSPTVVVRRSALDAIGGFWQPAGVPFVDHPTWLLLATEGAFAYHAEVMGTWRRHRAQWTTRAAGAVSGQAPEAEYVREVAQKRALDGASIAIPSPESLAHGHAERALLNHWRLALVAGNREAVGAIFRQLLGSRRPRLVSIALVGAAMWAIGSDLEWIQRRRNRVAWPSRRHMRRHGPSP